MGFEPRSIQLQSSTPLSRSILDPQESADEPGYSMQDSDFEDIRFSSSVSGFTTLVHPISPLSDASLKYFQCRTGREGWEVRFCTSCLSLI